MADAPDLKRTWQIPERLRLELLAALARDPDHTERMSYEEFLAWANEDTHAEWVDGRIVMPSPVSLRHQQIKNFLFAVLSKHAALFDAGIVTDGPFQMKMARNGREPDILFVAKAHLARLKTTYLDGPADIAIEIVSPESGARARGEKFYEYAEAGVAEYWLIDSTIGQAVFYRLDARNAYVQEPNDPSGVFRSQALPGFWLDVTWLWQEPLPEPETALLQIDGEVYRTYLRELLGLDGS